MTDEQQIRALLEHGTGLSPASGRWLLAQLDTARRDYIHEIEHVDSLRLGMSELGRELDTARQQLADVGEGPLELMLRARAAEKREERLRAALLGVQRLIHTAMGSVSHEIRVGLLMAVESIDAALADQPDKPAEPPPITEREERLRKAIAEAKSKVTECADFDSYSYTRHNIANLLDAALADGAQEPTK